MTGSNLGRRLVYSLTAAGILLLALLVPAGILLGDVRDLQNRVAADYFDAVVTSDDLFAGLIDSETAVRGYALTGNRDFLEPYTRAPQEQAADAAALADVRGRLADRPEVLAALQTAAESATAWSLDWAQPTVAAVDAGGSGSVSEQDVARGKVLFDQIRTDFAAYRDSLLAARADVLDDLRLRTRVLFGVLVAGGVGSVVVAALLFVALRRWVTRPVADLAGETRIVSDGNLTHRVEVEGPPEFIRLARDVDRMRGSLLDQLYAAEDARNELDAARERLLAQTEELQRSNRELEQFAYVASHDLQEPLRKVASFCQMLERRYKGQLDDRADQYIAFAVDGAKRMQQLINDLLSFSRVGRTSGRWETVELETCLRGALRNLEAAQEESGAEVSWDPLPPIDGEGGLLTQVFQNLVGNAMKFRGTAPPRVHIGAQRQGDEWEFSCADNGIGIEPQYADRIFVIFQRLHAKDEYEGTGIGLAMCKKIIEFHGGRIWLDTDVPVGTTFRWTLPVAGTRTAEAGPDLAVLGVPPALAPVPPLHVHAPERTAP